MSKVRPVGLMATPLYPLYPRYGGKVVDFHGWALPVQFSGIVKEHLAVRRDAGLFDISHMGEIMITGPDALALIQMLTVNDASRLRNGQVQYSAMCLPDGGIVDDITVYRFSEEKYLLCVNASNCRKDLEWILKHRRNNVTVQDQSSETALLAIQGPKAEYILKQLVDISLPALRYYHFVQGKVCGVDAVISRTGYTGEDGFELFLPAASAQGVWQKIMAAGSPLGLLPVGLGARDTLRLEMRYALYGLDIDAFTNPLEAGLGWITKTGKGDFVGKEAILKLKASGLKRKLVGFKVRGRGVARHGYPIWAGGDWAGVVTSGTYSPSLRMPIGLGYLPIPFSAPGSEIEIEVRDSKMTAEVVETPFYRQGSVKKE